MKMEEILQHSHPSALFDIELACLIDELADFSREEKDEVVKGSLLAAVGCLQKVREAFQRDFEKARYSEHLMDILCDAECCLHFTFLQMCKRYYDSSTEQNFTDARFIENVMRDIKECYKIFRV